MEINVKWFGDNFNVNLSSKPGEEEFLSIKGCRIVDGTKGFFVSWPATKNQSTGKYWNHVWGSERFNAVVLSKAQASIPKAPARRQEPAGSGDIDDIPF